MTIVLAKYVITATIALIWAVSSADGQAEEFPYDAAPEPTKFLSEDIAAASSESLYINFDSRTSDPRGTCSCACKAPAPPPPAPQFGGCFCCRPKLTGDWHGRRDCYAQHGVTFDADVTQFYFGVTDGGLNRHFDYGGHGDYVLNADLGKLGVHQGMFLKVRAEHRFGDSISDDTGAFMPATLLAGLPVRDSEDVYLTNVLFTQALSESFAVFAGKMDTLDGDANAFAHGRGKDQFSNLAFVANPLPLRTVPYSTLGAGFVILREMQPVFTFTVLNPTDTTRTSGFDELFSEGVTLIGEGRRTTSYWGLPGHQLVGGTWSSRDFVALGQDPRLLIGEVPIERQSGSWSVYGNFDQYLCTDPCDPKQGWGVFGRAGIADDEANPLHYFLSAGVGGSSMLRGRPADTFGIGYYYLGTSDEVGPILETLLGPIGDEQGVELFYNIAVTPWFHLAPDLQVIVPARENVDTTLVAGVRAKIDF